MLKIEDYISKVEIERGICYGDEFSKDLMLCKEVELEVMQGVLDILNTYDVKIGKGQFRRLIYPIDMIKGNGGVLFYEQLLDAIEIAIAVETSGLKVRGRMIVNNDVLLRKIGGMAKKYILNAMPSSILVYDEPESIESLDLSALKQWRKMAIDSLQIVKDGEKLSNKKQRVIPELYLILAPSFFEQGAVFWEEGQECVSGNMKLGACVYDIMVKMKMMEGRDYYDTKCKYDAVKGYLRKKVNIECKRLIISGENIRVEGMKKPIDITRK